MPALGLQTSAVDGTGGGFHPVFPFGVPSMTLGGTALEADLQCLQLTWHFLPISLGSCLFYSILSDF